jgi:hypothetical protein
MDALRTALEGELTTAQEAHSNELAALRTRFDKELTAARGETGRLQSLLDAAALASRTSSAEKNRIAAEKTKQDATILALGAQIKDLQARLGETTTARTQLNSEVGRLRDRNAAARDLSQQLTAAQAKSTANNTTIRDLRIAEETAARITAERDAEIARLREELRACGASAAAPPAPAAPAPAPAAPAPAAPATAAPAAAPKSPGRTLGVRPMTKEEMRMRGLRVGGRRQTLKNPTNEKKVKTYTRKLSRK